MPRPRFTAGGDARRARPLGMEGGDAHPADGDGGHGEGVGVQQPDHGQPDPREQDPGGREPGLAHAVGQQAESGWISDEPMVAARTSEPRAVKE